MTKRKAAVRKALDNMKGLPGGESLKPTSKMQRRVLAAMKHPFFGGCPRCRHLFWCSANRRCDRLPCEIGELPVIEED